METAGVGMLVAVAILLIATGLPAWMILIGVALLFAACGGDLTGNWKSVKSCAGAPSSCPSLRLR